MNQNFSDIEQSDVEKVNKAWDAIVKNDLNVARHLLEEVVANTPKEYIYSYEEGGRLFVKFWTEDEFLHYVTGLDDEQKKKSINWILSVYPRAYFYLAYIDMEEGRPENAIVQIKESLRLEPDQPVCFCEMALAYSKLGDNEKAIDLYDRALQSRLYIPSSAKVLALRGKGVVLIEMEELDLAKKCLIESLEYEPNNELALKELEYLSFLKTGGDAAPMSHKLIKSAMSERKCSICGKELITPYDGEFKVMDVGGQLTFLCINCGKGGNYKEAVNIKYNYAETYYNWGVNSFNQGRMEDAAEAFEKAINIEKDHWAAHFALGRVYIELERHEKAVTPLTEAIRIKPDFVEAFYYLGDAYFHLENYQDAMESYKQTIKIDPKHAQSHFSLGCVYRMLEQYNEAIEAFNHAIQINPKYPDPYSLLGWVFMELERYKEAIEAYKEVTKIDPNDVESHYCLGIIYLTLGDKKSASEEYEILKNLNEDVANKLLEGIHS